jgi:hypothetical protein
MADDLQVDLPYFLDQTLNHGVLKSKARYLDQILKQSIRL